ncbi:MAG: PD-(D/E)XK nuclease family protein, partial [Armatimonadota bacterium]
MKLTDPIAAAVAQVASPYQQATPYLGTSKITTFLYCPRQFYYGYILKVQVPGSPAATLGTAIHSVIQHAHRMNWTSANADEAKALMLE